MNLNGTCVEGVDWIQPSEDTVQLREHFNMKMKPQVLYKAGNFLIS
jgi:hypothetical protein